MYRIILKLFLGLALTATMDSCTVDSIWIRVSGRLCNDNAMQDSVDVRLFRRGSEVYIHDSLNIANNQGYFFFEHYCARYTCPDSIVLSRNNCGSFPGRVLIDYNEKPFVVRLVFGDTLFVSHFAEKRKYLPVLSFDSLYLLSHSVSE